MMDVCEVFMPDQQYHFDERPGCVLRHRSRATGTTIAVYRADQAGMDATAGDWVAMCEDHGTQYSFPNLRHARAHYATAPWCGGCHPNGIPGVPTPGPHQTPGPKVSPYVGISKHHYLSLNQQLYDAIGCPTYLRVRWQPINQQLVITAATAASVEDEDVYKTRTERRPDGTTQQVGVINPAARLRAAGLTPGKYLPELQGHRIIIKPNAKVRPSDDQANDEDSAENDGQAHH